METKRLSPNEHQVSPFTPHVSIGATGVSAPVLVKVLPIAV